jgi:hypothetical protein
MPDAKELYERSSKPAEGPTLDEIAAAIGNEVTAEPDALMRAAKAVRHLFAITPNVAVATDTTEGSTE